MSLCLILQHKDTMIMAADSRGCIKHNGQYYVSGDEIQKIHRINDKILFGSGSAQVITSIINHYKKASDQSIESLQKIAREEVENFINEFKDVDLDNTRHAELIVGCIENDTSVVYSISSYEDFRILRVEGDMHNNTIALGAHWDKAMALANKLQNSMHPVEMYKYIYNLLADEQMGGTLTLYALNKHGVFRYEQHKIIDSRPLKYVVFADDPNIPVHFNTTEGIKIQRNVGTQNAPIWEDKFYVNTDGKLVAEELITNKIKIKSDNDTLIDAETRTIDFSKFTTKLGTISASNIDATNLHVQAANIDGTIVAGAVQAGISISAPNVYGGNIIGSIITGSTIQTATTANKIILDSNGLRSHDLNGVKRISIDSDGNYGYQELRFYGQNGTQVGTVSGTNGFFNIAANNGATTIIGGNKIVISGEVTEIDFQNKPVKNLNVVARFA